MQLQGKFAVVTGASAGIGEALAQAATVAARRAGTPVVVANFHNVQLFQRKGQIARERAQQLQRDAVIHVSEQAHRDYLERL